MNDNIFKHLVLLLLLAFMGMTSMINGSKFGRYVPMGGGLVDTTSGALYINNGQTWQLYIKPVATTDSSPLVHP